MIFLEFSWNIPISKVLKICAVDDFFWDIPFTTKKSKPVLDTKFNIMWYLLALL